jgi:pyruvate/2-oxoglutarate dehydrogenase complex dihydrolipoamide acyltransferase (E2) component
MTTAIPIILERDNVNDESVVLVRWFAKHGEWVEANVMLAEMETSKANVEVFSPQAGFLIWSFPEGADVPVLEPIGYIAKVAPESTPEFVSSPSAPPPITVPRDRNAVKIVAIPGSAQIPEVAHAPTGPGPEFPISTPYRQRFTPVAAKMMEVHSLKPSDFAVKSIVREQDVHDFLNPPTTPSHSVIAASAVGTYAKISQPYKEITLSKMKRREGQSLAAGVGNAVQSAVSVTCFTRGLRRNFGDKTANANVSAVIVYEVSRLLRKYPTLNATYRDGIMIQFLDVNLGYAMDDGRGLKVAVLQNCDTLSLEQISTLLRELTVAYIEDKLTPTQIANGTFTISDLSGMGVSSFYPLISENQGGILGIGEEQFLPDVAYGFYTLTLAFDHQLSDGRTAAFFLNDLKSRLQSYESTLWDVRHELACSQCGRTAEQLDKMNQNLLLSALPRGYICTICCMMGY